MGKQNMLPERKMLWVEDDPMMLDVLNLLFEAEGAKVFVAENGAVAKEIVQNHQIDIIVSDVQMPICDGVDLLKWIKERYEDIPMVFLSTGFADISDEAALSLGAEAIIKKPFKAEKIIGCISQSFEKLRKYKESLGHIA